MFGVFYTETVAFFPLPLGNLILYIYVGDFLFKCKKTEMLL